MIDMEKLGNEIKTRREKKAITQEELAEKVNITRQTLARLENGETPNPGINTITKIAVVLGINTITLLRSAT